MDEPTHPGSEANPIEALVDGPEPVNVVDSPIPAINSAVSANDQVDSAKGRDQSVSKPDVEVDVRPQSSVGTHPVQNTSPV